MSVSYYPQAEKYSRPQLPSIPNPKYPYGQNQNLTSLSNIAMQNHDRNNYPSSGKHSRLPTLVNCNSCNDLSMTDIQYQHGMASKIWCTLLMPFLCTGFCCLCLNSCKDVKHSCTKCGADLGTCKSSCV